MDHKQLEYFKALYLNGSITKTAGELYLTRQALSLSIRKLEQEVGAALFRRTQSGLVPTRAAHALYRYVQEQERLYRDVLRQIREMGPEVTLRFAAHVMYFTAEEIRYVKAFRELPGGCRIQLVNVTDSGRCQTLIEEGQADIASTHKPPSTARLHCTKRGDSGAYLVMRADNPLTSRERIDFSSEMGGQSLLFVSMETLREVEPLLRAQGASCSFIASDRVLLQQSIAMDGSAMVVPSQCRDNFLGEGMLSRELKNFPVVNGRYLIYERESPEILRFIEYYSKRSLP